MDEEKEPHYVLGKSRQEAFDYTGAIEAFEESLEANPHSAQAHYQLAMLYENQDAVADPAAAIYHYQQYLKYDPKADNADLVAQHIATCKQKLAENVLQKLDVSRICEKVEIAGAGFLNFRLKNSALTQTLDAASRGDLLFFST